MKMARKRKRHHVSQEQATVEKRYSVMAGTPEKMLEHLLETALDNNKSGEHSNVPDHFLEDFLLTHVIFMPNDSLCPSLLTHYHAKSIKNDDDESTEYAMSHKHRVVRFVQEWYRLAEDTFMEDKAVHDFLEELRDVVEDECNIYPSLRSDLADIEAILKNYRLNKAPQTNPPVESKRRISPSVMLTKKMASDLYIDSINKRQPIKATDESIVKVYCADHTYTTLRVPMDTPVQSIIDMCREKLGLGEEELVLCEIKSSGDKSTYRLDDLCITTGLSLNGLLFISPRKHTDALTPHPSQEGPALGTSNQLDLMSTKEVAYHMTTHDWELFTCVIEQELIYLVMGRHQFGAITANLDIFLRRFNEIQYWVVTEMMLAQNVGKRVQLLRKFIKIAAHCKEYQNLHSFFAIVMGLSNIAVSRLSQTWEKLPSKFKKMFADFETLMDPSRNHRVYRLFVAKLTPPIIPFMPLLMKDLTFTHDGNKTYFDGLVNFEKMHMIAQTLRTVKFCRGRRLELEPPSTIKSNSDIEDYIRYENLKIIDNQRLLTQLSYKLEPRRT